MAELDAKDRDRLRFTQFAYVDSKGGEHLPIHDESHVRNAIARFNQTDFESEAAKERARRMFESSSTSMPCIWAALRIFRRARSLAALLSNSV